MNKNCLGVARLNENAIIDSTVPNGFIVREKKIDGKPVSLEYGIYLTNEIFLGVPIHFSLKEKLMVSNSNTEEFNYYIVPQTMQFAVRTYKNKNTGKINPILVEPTDKNPAVFISCLAFGNNIDSIINVTMDKNSKVIRKYIDKDRKVIGIIAFNTDTNVINPTTTITIKHGILDSESYTTEIYTFDPLSGCTKNSDVESTEAGTRVKTEFINLESYIRPYNDSKSKNVSRSSKPNNTNKYINNDDNFKSKNFSNSLNSDN